MTLTTTVQAMIAAGCSAEQIATVVAAHEAEAEKEGVRKRELNAARQQRYRERHPDRVTQHNDARRQVTPGDVTSLPKKERVPPTPPLLEKTPTLFIDSPTESLTPQEKKDQDFKALADWFEGQWNAFAAACGLSKTKGMTGQRVVLIRQRAEDLVGVLGFPNPQAGFIETFNRIRGSPLLRGENDRGWAADIDWVLKEKNFLKIHEGNYEKKPKPFLVRR